MSELMTTTTPQSGRWRLWTTVSAMALMAGGLGLAPANAEGGNAPSIWIELGGQLERIDGGQEAFAPPFVTREPRPDYEKGSLVSGQHLPRYGIGGEGKIAFRPEGSDWAFSASARYGRSNGSKALHYQQTYVVTGTLFPGFSINKKGYLHSDLAAKHSESHAVLDFSAGRDVGVGMFGRQGESTVNFGVRFAQFHSKSDILLRSGPDYLEGKYIPTFHKTVPLTYHHSYSGTEQVSRSFKGIGPSVSWDASSGIAGNSDTAELTFDWGVNGAILFGRQKVSAQHQSKLTLKTALMTAIPSTVVYSHRPPSKIRPRSVIVPNLGGFAGLSVKFPNAKVSLGYRADFFFGAMDGGIDTRKSYDRNFFGPYARIGIGL